MLDSPHLIYARLAACFFISVLVHTTLLLIKPRERASSSPPLIGRLRPLSIDYSGLSDLAAPKAPLPDIGKDGIYGSNFQAGEIELGNLPGPRFPEPYIPAAELDIRPRPMGELPSYLPTELLTQQDGSVVFDIFLSEAGSVDKIEVKTSSAPKALIEHLVRQLSASKFVPGYSNSKPKKALWTIEFTYSTTQIPPASE